MPHPRLTLIAAVARNRVIGLNNQLPWHLPEDLKHFRTITQGHPVIMGRKTWESLPDSFRPLPGRLNLVMSRQENYQGPGARMVKSLPEALESVSNTPEAFVIGGAELYAQALPIANRLILTEVEADVAGDAWFPEFDRTLWLESSREVHVSQQGLTYAFVTYERI